MDLNTTYNMDSLDEFYSLWKMEHTPQGHIEAPVSRPLGKPEGTVARAVPAVGTKPRTMSIVKKQEKITQLPLFG